jgi:hypothetical protein
MRSALELRGTGKRFPAVYFATGIAVVAWLWPRAQLGETAQAADEGGAPSPSREQVPAEHDCDSPAVHRAHAAQRRKACHRFRLNANRMPLRTACGESGGLATEVVPFRDARCQGRRCKIVRNGRLMICGHLVQMGASGVQPIMAGHPFIGIQGC